MMTKRSLAVLLLGVLVAARAPIWADERAVGTAVTYRNPILDRPGAADPTVIAFEGKYYLYPTLDSKGYEVFVSTDLVHWESKGKCFTDSRGGVWAPDVFYYARGDKRFYLYYTADNPGGGKLIGVAVADSLLGPFVDRGTLAEGAIDAHLFEDDDGRMYLYHVDLKGGFKIVAQPMKDPLTKMGEAAVVIRPDAAWERAKGSVTEGPWMMKRGGVYYLMYSGSGADGPDYAIGYATSKSPMGPFEKYAGNPIARRGNGIFGPGHHCVVIGPDGKYWMFYHQKADDRVNWRRFVAMDPLWFDEDGVIHVKLSRGTEEKGPVVGKN
jgi:xylan 1,4-beta-xylosidase